ncbi:MAG TPA: energy transducer TonB [Bacteroidia bacterium]|nr:energy transducer TonB [Bacteroidia bacterium]
MKQLCAISVFILVTFSSLAAQDTLSKETMPEFPGGEYAFQTYLQNNIIYPQSALDAGLDGTVYVYFEIATDGSIGNVQVKKGIPEAPDLDTEAVRVISTMPNWSPGMIDGKPVKVSMTVPVKFALSPADIKKGKRKSKRKSKSHR